MTSSCNSMAAKMLSSVVSYFDQKRLTDALSYFSDNDENKGVEAVKGLAPKLQNSLYRHYWLMSGCPRKLDFGRILASLSGDTQFKARVVHNYIESNPTLITDEELVVKTGAIIQRLILEDTLDLSHLSIPKPSDEIELKLVRIIRQLLKNNVSIVRSEFSGLSVQVRKKVLQVYSRLFPTEIVSDFLDHKGDGEKKIIALIYYLRNNYIPHEEELNRRIIELKKWTKLINYERHSIYGRQEGNAQINQWDVYPYDHTRVVLDDGRYINANFVFNKYILTQSPVTVDCKTSSPCNTVDLFWQMVWQKNVSCIAMINGENGVDFFKYYPDEIAESKQVDNLTITLDEKKVYTIFSKLSDESPKRITQRKLSLVNHQGDSKVIFHFKAEDWRDFTRGDEQVILKMIDLIDEVDIEGAPILIHCRAGVGRTAQLVTVHHLSKRAKEGLEFDVIDTVKALRDPITGRAPYMMQGVEQILYAQRILFNIKCFK